MKTMNDRIINAIENNKNAVEFTIETYHPSILIDDIVVGYGIYDRIKFGDNNIMIYNNNILHPNYDSHTNLSQETIDKLKQAILSILKEEI